MPFIELNKLNKFSLFIAVFESPTIFRSTELKYYLHVLKLPKVISLGFGKGKQVMDKM